MTSNKTMSCLYLILMSVWLAVTAVESTSQRIVGGLPTTINVYPYMVSLEYSWNLETFRHTCAGSILNSRYVLSVAHCFQGHHPVQWRARFSSSWANSNGWLYQVDAITLHPDFNADTYEDDIAILRTDRAFEVAGGLELSVASLGSAAYDATLADNVPVVAIGWGASEHGGSHNMQLHEVDMSVVNQAACRSRYADVGISVPGKALCAGWLDIGGKDQCTGDEGGPLLHDRVVVGVYSLGYGCAHASYPSLNTRVGPYITWIQSIANHI